MEQGTLGEFERAGGGGDERPAAEAEAVAGDGGGDGDAPVRAVSEREFPDADGDVEFAVTQVDYTIEGRGDDEHPVLHVFGRVPIEDGGDRRVHARVHGFRPYFYTPISELDIAVDAEAPLEASDVVDSRLDHDRLTGLETHGDRAANGADTGDHDAAELVVYESIRGESLLKVFGQTPRDVGELRDRFEHYEADILFPNRLLIDKDITSGVRVPTRRLEDGSLKIHHTELDPVDVEADSRVHTLDIEVDDRHGFPEDGEQTIICLTAHDSYRDEYVIWLQTAEGSTAPATVPNYDPLGDDGLEIDVRSFDDEAAMLDDYLDYIDETDPDLLTGWNCLPADSEILMADGCEQEIEDIEVGDLVVGSDEQTSTVAKVTNKWQSEKPIYRFELADGTSLRTSGDHRTMVGDEEAVDWKQGRDIEPGDYVLKPRKLRVDSPRVPTLAELVPNERQRFTEESVREFKRELPYGAVSELADTFDVSKGTLWTSQPTTWSIQRCETAPDLHDVALPDGGTVAKRTEKPLDRELTEHELYLAGLVLTDGSMSTSDGIRFYNTRTELHDQFPGDPTLEPDGKGCYKQNVLDFATMRAFNGLGIPFGDKNATDVDLSTIYGMPEAYIARFLAGAVDGDGNIASSVTIAAKNPTIGDWYAKLFRRLGIYAERNDTTVRIPDAERDIERFKKRVLPHMNYPEKIARVKALEGGKSGRSENIPPALFEAEIGSDAKRIGNDKQRRGINLKRHETLAEEWEEHVFVEVKNIETVGTETTYDIETTTHDFVADGCLVHNCDDFDFPYLIDRIDRLSSRQDRLDSDRLSRIDEVWDSGWGGPDIKGRVVFDLLYAYQRTQFSELDSYRLDAVGEEELGVGKERYPGDIGDLWSDDPERLLEYNLRDVELCVELDRKQEIIPFWEEVASFVGCKLEDATTPGDAVDMYVLHEIHGEFALPSKGHQESEEYEGGAVFDPISGVKEMVSVLDLKSLYPMCMVTINASPETKVDPDAYDGDTYVAPNGTHFRKEPDGMIREMVDELLEEREEKKSLRNENDPGSDAYETFDRQQAAVKVIMNCFTPDTDVLTPSGIRNIRDLDIGDEVYSLDPDTMEMEIKPVVDTHEYPDYRGELVDIETSKIDFSVTPNHRMLVRKNDKNGITEDGWDFIEAGDLHDYCHYEMPHEWDFDHDDTLPNRIDLTEMLEEHTSLKYTMADGCGKVAAKYGQPNVQSRVPTNRFLELLAWYITEGNVHEAKPGNYRVKIAQENAEERTDIENLIDSIVDYYYVTDRSVSFSSRPLGELLESLCGSGSENKRIPELVFEGSREQKELFLDILIAGDGDRQTNSWRYSTKSKQLRDDVLRLCTHLGLTATYNSDSGVWRIYCSEDGKNSFQMYRDGSRSTADDGVYCVTVEDNNTLIAGRNGKLHNVSNSLYGVLGWDRFRLYDKEMGAAVTATGREVIEYTEQAASELDKDVIYGDSVTGDRPIVVRDPDGMVRILPIEELFVRSEPTSNDQVLITADGGPVRTVDVAKEYGSLDGWNALSMDEDGTAEWQLIESVMRHETDKPVVNLQHKVGESTTTRDHSYVVKDSGEFVEATPTEIDEPLRVSDFPVDSEINVIDVYDVLHGYEREYEDGRGTGGTTVKTKRVHANDEHVWFGHEHHDELESTIMVQRYIEPGSQDCVALCRLLAAYVTEGSATTEETAASKFGASIAESRSEWLDELRNDYHRLFENTTASVIANDINDKRTVEYKTDGVDSEVCYDDQTKKLQMMNELAAVFFREFAGQTSRGKRIPSFVYHLSESEQSLFLETLIEGDGSREFPRYSAEYAERNFDFETTSRELAAGLSMLLTQRGMKHSLKYRDSKNSYTIRTVDSYRKGREPILDEIDHDGYVYDLSVAENENFVDGVGGVILHNTDSVMLELDHDISKKDAIEQSFEIEDHINDAYDEFAERLNASTHRFQIEFEKLYRRFFQAGKKKRYAGHIVWKEGKDVDDIDITGFEYKRSDIAPITKEVQKKVLEMIVTGSDPEDIKSYVGDVIERVQAGDVSLDEIGIPGGIGKKLDNYDTDTAQVRGAKYANLLFGTNFASGSKPKRLYLEKVHPSFFREIEAELDLDPSMDQLYGEFKREAESGEAVICFEYEDQVPDAFEVDHEKMLDKTLKGPIARILEALDISWDEVESGQEQTGLESFM